MQTSFFVKINNLKREVLLKNAIDLVRKKV